ncbi:MAG: beta-glucosidase [Candidatus Hodarchaeota archaeon]
MVESRIKKGMTRKEIDDFVDHALSELTLKEKVSLMSGVKDFLRDILEDEGVGGRRAYRGTEIERLGIPPYIFTDGPRGCVIDGSTCFPVTIARGASWDVELEERIGEAMGKEVRAHGGNFFGGVCVNILRHPSWGRSQETFGEDPFLLGEMGSALTRGIQKHNVMATVKHYALNNIENTRFKVNVETDERTLREMYLPHFKRIIEEGCATVMSAYNKFRGKYCGHNDYLLRTILKGEWGFEGFVHSDWFHGLRDTMGGITGGLDVEMPKSTFYGRKLLKAAKKEEVDITLIDEATRRIIRTVLKFTTREDHQEYDKELIACADHVQLALETAEKSMVLLKNEGGLLPLDLKEISSVAVIGKLADLVNTGDRGSSNVHQDNIITHLEGIKQVFGENSKVIHDDGSDITNTKKIAQQADVSIIIVGLTYEDESENIPGDVPGMESTGDRLNLGLKENEIELINEISKINPKSIVVLVGGGAILMEEWKDNVPAILMSWYSGMQGGIALANILSGKANPGGKLPFTITTDPSHYPLFDAETDEIKYDYYHGYMLMDKENITPAFPFGFGLSYTSFKHENLKAKVDGDSIVATVDVTNTGKVIGDEVTQLYIGLENSSVDRPRKVLKGFTRTTLEPSETKNITIVVKKRDLAWYNPDSHEWEVENMKYKILVGSSSVSDELLSTDLEI